METLKNIKPIEVIPRVIADYALVHICMLLAFAGPILYQVRVGNGAHAEQLARQLESYYLVPFTALSFVFPLAFLLHGFYTKSRVYMSRHKRLVVLQGSVTAVLIFVAANLLFSNSLVPRTVVVLFGSLVPMATIGARELKNMLVRHFADASELSVKAPENNEQILVVGGAGYIGSILVRDLLGAGYRVRVLDSLLYGYQSLQPILGHPRLELVVGDCRHIQSVVKAAHGVKSIVHLAAIVGDPACEFDHRTALEINYAATRMLIEVAKGNAVQRFLFASSCSVYGASDLLCDESAVTRPISLYAETKINSERVLLQSRSDLFHPTILRLATLFGNSYRPRFDLVVNLLTAKAKQEQVITIYNGQQWRPFLHVRDVSRGFMAVLHAPLGVVSGQIFNAGDSRLNYTLGQVGELIRQEFPNTRIEQVDNQDGRDYRVSFAKIKKQLGFQSTITMEEGIRQLKIALEESPDIQYKDALYSNLRFLQSVGSPAYEDAIDGRVMAAFTEETDQTEHALV